MTPKHQAEARARCEAEVAEIRADILHALGWAEEAEDGKQTSTIGLLTVLMDSHAKGMAVVDAEVGRLRALCREAAGSWDEVDPWPGGPQWSVLARVKLEAFGEYIEAVRRAGGEAGKEGA